MTFKEMQTAHCVSHEETELGCVDCVIAQQDAACAHLTTAQKAKKFTAGKKAKSAVERARPVAAQTVNHVAGDVPQQQRCYAFTGDQGTLKIIVSSDGTALMKNEEGALVETTAKVAQEVVDALQKKVSERTLAGGEVPHFQLEKSPSAAHPQQSTPLQLPLEGVGPAALSEVTIAKGFILAGNAYFTVRSVKTGTRYTYRVNRAKCSRCGKTDCQCWAYPNYFVALLTGPDNTEDYQYLGMLGQAHEFRLTRASRMDDASAPVKAFKYVWGWLQRGQMPPQCEIWHEGRCGRCGRRLTVPESVERGIGPECAGRMGL